jgi:hypothetical protein
MKNTLTKKGILIVTKKCFLLVDDMNQVKLQETNKRSRQYLSCNKIK